MSQVEMRHSKVKQNIHVLPELVAHYRERGWKPVTDRVAVAAEELGVDLAARPTEPTTPTPTTKATDKGEAADAAKGKG